MPTVYLKTKKPFIYVSSWWEQLKSCQLVENANPKIRQYLILNKKKKLNFVSIKSLAYMICEQCLREGAMDSNQSFVYTQSLMYIYTVHVIQMLNSYFSH